MRYLSDQELIDTDQEDMLELSKIFNHRIVANMEGREKSNEVWRWEKQSTAGTRIQKFVDVHGLNLLILSVKRDKMFSLEEFMRFDMQNNHSLCFIGDSFGQCEVTEFRLPYLSPPPDDWDFDKNYWQTPIEYIREKHRGQVLQFAEDGKIKTPT